MASNTRRLAVSEFAFYEVDQRYTRESGTLENDATVAGTSPSIAATQELIGQPLRLVSAQWQFASTADVTAGNVDGFVVDSKQLPAAMAAAAITVLPYAILARGPALINEGRIPALDVYGDAITSSEYVTAAEALNIQTKILPTATSLTF